jgi:hypothetical protein
MLLQGFSTSAAVLLLLITLLDPVSATAGCSLALQACFAQTWLAINPVLLSTLQQVVAILAAGHELPFKVEPAKLDLPELQGEPEEISIEKCRKAAKQVRLSAGVLLCMLVPFHVTWL